MEKIKLSRMAYRMTRSMSDETLQKHVETMKQTKKSSRENLQRDPSTYSTSEECSSETTLTQRKMKAGRLALPEFKV